MRISPVNSVSYYCSKPTRIHSKQNSVQRPQPSFHGKHSSAKFWGGLFGAVGTLWATILTGGTALPFILGYGALSAGIGATLGHIVDKGNDEFNKKTAKENNKHVKQEM